MNTGKGLIGWDGMIGEQVHLVVHVADYIRI